MSDNCTFPACNKYKKPGSQYCYDHGRLMGNKSDKTAVAPTPIAKVSDNMKEQMKLYKKLRKPFLTKHFKCEVKGCKHASQEIHHKKGRVGDLLLDQTHWMAVCHEHHQRITEDSEWAYSNSYSEKRLTA